MPTGRVIVTGATGFIGRWSVPALLAGGYEVHAISSRAATDRALAAQGNVRTHIVDLFDPSAMRTALQDIRATHLLHFAWNATPGIYWTSTDNYRWVAATLELVRAFQEFGGQRFVGAGTCAEYDWARVEECREDSSPLATDGALVPTPYAASKVALNKMLAAYSRYQKLSLAWGRIFFQFGPFEHPDRLVPSVILSLLSGQEAKVSHGMQVRNFLHVRDVAEAFVALLSSPVEGAVNIGSRHRGTLRELITTVAQLCDREDLLRFGARPSGNEPAVLVPNVERLYDEVRWQPAFDLRSGLADTVAWWRERMDTRPSPAP